MKYIDAFFKQTVGFVYDSCKNPAGSHDNYHLYSCVLRYVLNRSIRWSEEIT